MPAPDRELPKQKFLSSVEAPKGIWGHYTDVEMDAMLDEIRSSIGSGGGGGGAVTVHDFAPPSPQDGVTPADMVALWAPYHPGLHVFGSQSERYFVVLAKTSISGTTNVGGVQKPTTTDAVSLTMTISGAGWTLVQANSSTVDGVHIQTASVLVSQLGGTLVRMSSTKGDVPFAIAGMADLFSLSAGGSAATVYEQDNAPPAANTGDLWLAPITADRQIESLIADSKDTPLLDERIREIARLVAAGGNTVPPDIGWTECPKVAGSGFIEARLLNGVVELRGELVITLTSTGSPTHVRNLPSNFPKPVRQESWTVCSGKEQNVSFRRVNVGMFPNGGIVIVGDGKITHADLGGARAYVY